MCIRDRRGYRRDTGIFLLLGLGAVCILIFVLFLWPTVAHIIGSLGDRFPQLIDLARNDLIPWVERTFNVQAPSNLDAVMAEYGETLQAQLPQQMTAWAPAAASCRMSSAVRPAMQQYTPLSPVGMEPSQHRMYSPWYSSMTRWRASSAAVPAAAIRVSV